MTDFSHETTLSFEYDEQRRARVVARSVRQEIGEIDDERSTTGIERSGRTVTVDVRAADLVALRAAQNTWLSLVDVAERAAAAGEEQLAAGE